MTDGEVLWDNGLSGQFALTPPARGNARGRLPKAARKGETTGKERINSIVHAGSGASQGGRAGQCHDGKDGKRKRGVIHLNRVFSFQAQAMKGGPID